MIACFFFTGLSMSSIIILGHVILKQHEIITEQQESIKTLRSGIIKLSNKLKKQ